MVDDSSPTMPPVKGVAWPGFSSGGSWLMIDAMKPSAPRSMIPLAVKPAPPAIPRRAMSGTKDEACGHV